MPYIKTLPKPDNRPSLHYRITVKDIEGRIEYDSGLKESGSWVLNLLKVLYVKFAQANLAGVVDTGGTSRTMLSAANIFGTAPINTATYGIVVGTGTNAVAITDTALQTPIATGSGAGQLNYQLMRSATVPTISSTQLVWTWGRDFINNSGGSITVQEIGQVLDDTSGGWFFLIMRDLTGGVAVGNTKTLSVDYTWTQGL